MADESEGGARGGLRHRLRGAVREALRSGLAGLGSRAPSRPVGPAKVEFVGLQSGLVPPGSTLLGAAQTLGVDLNHYCGGICSCGTCWVHVVAGAEHLSPIDGRERMVLGHERSTAGARLACQARVEGPVTVKIPRWS
jgi:ferredoxin